MIERLRRSGRKPDTQRAPQPKPLPIVPFLLDTCTLVEPATADEQAAFDAHVRTCATRDDFWNRATQADWMLDVLRSIPYDGRPVPEIALRTFALRCVEPLDGVSGGAGAMLMDVVRRRLAGAATAAELQSVREKARPAVTPAGVQGLPRCVPHAAGVLAAWHAADPNPFEAAFWTAEFAARHDAFVEMRAQAESSTGGDERAEDWRSSWRVAFFAREHPERYRKALAAARTRQANLLRTFLPSPFAQVERSWRPA